MMKNSCVLGTKETISSIIMNDSNVVPHCLMEISSREWIRFKENSVHLTSSYTDNKKIFYKDVTWGKNCVTQKRKLVSNGEALWVKEVNLSRMKHNFFDYNKQNRIKR